MTIPEIFATRGEPYFRAGEARVIARLLESGPHVLATGGGAFMDPGTRAAIRRKAISVWLRAEFDVLIQNPDPGETLRRLMTERSPVYAEADIVVESRDVAHEAVVDEVLNAVRCRLDLPDVAAERIE
jgi:shikimate kinase